MSAKLLLILLTGSLILSAGQPPVSIDDRVHISIQMKGGSGKSVTLSTPNSFTLEPTELNNTKFDVTGKAVLDLPISQLQFVNLRVGEKFSTLLVAPGDAVQINVSADKTSSFAFLEKDRRSLHF